MTASLSHKAQVVIANALAPKVAEEIMQSEGFIEYLHKVIPALIDAEVGEMDDDLLFDLSMMTMERLVLCATEYN